VRLLGAGCRQSNCRIVKNRSKNCDRESCCMDDTFSIAATAIVAALRQLAMDIDCRQAWANG
jgi:hypothetical protein